jgi:hypothetical protein
MSPKDTLIQLTRDFKPAREYSSDHQILEEWREGLSEPHRLFCLVSWSRVSDLLGHLDPSVRFSNFERATHHGWGHSAATKRLFLTLKTILDEEEEVKMEDFL